MKYLLIAVAAAVAQVGSVTPVVGLWETDGASRGGIGGSVEFRADGTFTQSTTVLVDGFYRVVGDRLFRGLQPAVDVESAPAEALSFRGNQCLMTRPDGVVVTKERMGQPKEGVPPLVGVWRYQHQSGALAFEHYTEDGRMFLRIPLASKSGRFTAGDGTIVLTAEGGTETRGALMLQENALTLTDGSSNLIRWRRVPEGPWYQPRN